MSHRLLTRIGMTAGAVLVVVIVIGLMIGVGRARRDAQRSLVGSARTHPSSAEPTGDPAGRDSSPPFLPPAKGGSSLSSAPKPSPAPAKLPTELPHTPEIDQALSTIYPELPSDGRREQIDYTLRYHAFIDRCLNTANVHIDKGYVLYWWHGVVVEDGVAKFTELERIESDLTPSDERAWLACAEEFIQENRADVPGFTVDGPGIDWVKKTVFPIRDHWLYRFIASNGQIIE